MNIRALLLRQFVKRYYFASLRALLCRLPQCYFELCSYCVLLGSHASVDRKEHKLISTTDAFARCINGSDDPTLQSDMTAEGHHMHWTMDQILKNLRALAQQIEEVETEVRDKIEIYVGSVLDYLNALKREYVLELLNINLIEGFWRHVSQCLRPAQYLRIRSQLQNIIAAWVEDHSSSAHIRAHNASALAAIVTGGSLYFASEQYMAPTSVPLSSLLPDWMMLSVSLTDEEIEQGAAIFCKLNIEGDLSFEPANATTKSADAKTRTTIPEWADVKPFQKMAFRVGEIPVDMSQIPADPVYDGKSGVDGVSGMVAISLHDNEQAAHWTDDSTLAAPAVACKEMATLWSLLSDHSFEGFQHIVRLPIVPDKHALIKATMQIALLRGDIENLLTVCAETAFRIYYERMANENAAKTFKKDAVLIDMIEILATESVDATSREHFLTQRDSVMLKSIIAVSIKKLEQGNWNPSETELMATTIRDIIEVLTRFTSAQAPQILQLITDALTLGHQRCRIALQSTGKLDFELVAAYACLLIFSHVLAPITVDMGNAVHHRADAANALASKFLFLGFQAWAAALNKDHSTDAEPIIQWVLNEFIRRINVETVPFVYFAEVNRVAVAATGYTTWIDVLNFIDSNIEDAMREGVIAFNWTEWLSPTFEQTLNSLFNLAAHVNGHRQEGLARKSVELPSDIADTVAMTVDEGGNRVSQPDVVREEDMV